MQQSGVGGCQADSIIQISRRQPCFYHRHRATIRPETIESSRLAGGIREMVGPL